MRAFAQLESTAERYLPLTFFGAGIELSNRHAKTIGLQGRPSVAAHFGEWQIGYDNNCSDYRRNFHSVLNCPHRDAPRNASGE